MYLPMASGVWSFCHEVAKKSSWHCLPANSWAPALVSIMNVPLPVTVGATASRTLDQITPATKLTRCFLSISSATCLPTSGLAWSSP